MNIHTHIYGYRLAIWCRVVLFLNVYICSRFFFLFSLFRRCSKFKKLKKKDDAALIQIRRNVGSIASKVFLIFEFKMGLVLHIIEAIIIS